MFICMDSLKNTIDMHCRNSRREFWGFSLSHYRSGRWTVEAWLLKQFALNVDELGLTYIESVIITLSLRFCRPEAAVRHQQSEGMCKKKKYIRISKCFF